MLYQDSLQILLYIRIGSHGLHRSKLRDPSSWWASMMPTIKDTSGWQMGLTIPQERLFCTRPRETWACHPDLVPCFLSSCSAPHLHLPVAWWEDWMCGDHLAYRFFLRWECQDSRLKSTSPFSLWSVCPSSAGGRAWRPWTITKVFFSPL